jgi:hypothetical protein
VASSSRHFSAEIRLRHLANYKEELTEGKAELDRALAEDAARLDYEADYVSQFGDAGGMARLRLQAWKDPLRRAGAGLAEDGASAAADRITGAAIRTISPHAGKWWNVWGHIRKIGGGISNWWHGRNGTPPSQPGGDWSRVLCRGFLCHDVLVLVHMILRMVELVCGHIAGE